MECPDCGAEAGAIREGAERCHRCERLVAPTPLQEWLENNGVTLRQLAEDADVSHGTIMSAAIGKRMSKRVAEKLAAVTDLPLETFRPEVSR